MRRPLEFLSFSRLTDERAVPAYRKRGLPRYEPGFGIPRSTEKLVYKGQFVDQSWKIGRTPVGSECSRGPTNQLIAKPSYRFNVLCGVCLVRVYRVVTWIQKKERERLRERDGDSREAEKTHVRKREKARDNASGERNGILSSRSARIAFRSFRLRAAPVFNLVRPQHLLLQQPTAREVLSAELSWRRRVPYGVRGVTA